MILSDETGTRWCHSLRLGGEDGLKWTSRWRSAGGRWTWACWAGESKPHDRPAQGAVAVWPASVGARMTAVSAVEGGVETVRVENSEKVRLQRGGFAFCMRQVTQAVEMLRRRSRAGRLEPEGQRRPQSKGPEQTGRVGLKPRAQLTLHGGGEAGVCGGRSAGLEPGGQSPWLSQWRRRQGHLPMRRKKQLGSSWQRF